MPYQLGRNCRSHAIDDRQERPFDEIERRRHEIMRAAFEYDMGRTIGEDQGRQDRLQNEICTSRRANSEPVVSGFHRSWPKSNFGASNSKAIAFGFTDGACGFK